MFQHSKSEQFHLLGTHLCLVPFVEKQMACTLHSEGVNVRCCGPFNHVRTKLGSLSLGDKFSHHVAWDNSTGAPTGIPKQLSNDLVSRSPPVRRVCHLSPILGRHRTRTRQTLVAEGPSSRHELRGGSDGTPKPMDPLVD